MNEFTAAASFAFWLGILASISPCALATNVAAMSFIGRGVESPRKVFFSGLLFSFGRSLTYLAIGGLLATSLLSVPALAQGLQKYMNQALGPILILVGLILLDVIAFRFSTCGLSDKAQKKMESVGAWGTVLLGILFGLSFCPAGAALFFGSLLPLALKQESGLVLPAIFGVATSLPVVLFAVLISFGANRVGLVLNRLRAFEWWAKRLTGACFMVIGVNYCLLTFWGISLF